MKALRGLIGVGVFVLVALQPIGAEPALSPRIGYVVWDASAETITAAGGSVVDEYEGFVHANLTEAQVEALRESGYPIETLTFGIRRGAYMVGDSIPEALRASPTTQYSMVELRGPIKAERLTGITASGGSIVEYLPPFGVLVRANALALQGIGARPEVASITPYHPAFKISTLLPDAGSFPATAFADKTAEFTLVKGQIQLTGATLRESTTSASRHIIDLTLTRAQLVNVAKIDAVTWIEPAFDFGEARINKSSGLIQSGQDAVYSINSMGINGSTQKVVVCDNGIETFVNDSHTTRTVMWVKHEVFNDSKSDPADAQIEYQAHLASPSLALPEHRKILLYYSPVENGNTLGDHKAPAITDPSPSHGTQTSGIVAGDKPAFGARDQFDGVAYAAKLFLCDASKPNAAGVEAYFFANDAWNYLWPAWDRGATVASFSFGANATPAYTEPARQMDEIVWYHRNLTIARAIGNMGTTAGQDPETVAKSVLSVGGTNNQPCQSTPCASDGDSEKVAVFSSRGPAADGRTKPNVVAGGFCVRAPAMGGPGYNCQAGTSYAAPTIAGAAALVRDYLHKGFYPSGAPSAADERKENVSAALVHAMLMASGKDLAHPGAIPNNNEGWGRPILDNVLYFNNESNTTQKLLIKDEWESGNVTTGSSWQRTFHVNSGTAVRIFLAWSDYPGTVGSPLAIVNDLDLRVAGPACSAGIFDDICIGNAWITGTNETASGKERPADRLNVEEAVYLCRAPLQGSCAVPTGDYTVRVQGFNVYESQPFAVVITGDVQWV